MLHDTGTVATLSTSGTGVILLLGLVLKVVRRLVMVIYSNDKWK